MMTQQQKPLTFIELFANSVYGNSSWTFNENSSWTFNENSRWTFNENSSWTFNENSSWTFNEIINSRRTVKWNHLMDQ